MANQTSIQYDAALASCRRIFLDKNRDYGTSWRIMRPSSITDQLWIKAQRIRSIEQKGVSRIDEGMDSEYRGIVNYCIIALIQLDLGDNAENIPEADLLSRYDAQAAETKLLMESKNHDYGEAWREMRISTFTDMILARLLRIRQIEDNQGQTLVSEGPESNYRDMMNYAIFALIRLTEQEKSSAE